MLSFTTSSIIGLSINLHDLKMYILHVIKYMDDWMVGF